MRIQLELIHKPLFPSLFSFSGACPPGEGGVGDPNLFKKSKANENTEQ